MTNDIDSLSYVSTKRLDDILLLVAIAISRGDVDELQTAREVAREINAAKEMKQARLLQQMDEPQITAI